MIYVLLISSKCPTCIGRTRVIGAYVTEELARTRAKKEVGKDEKFDVLGLDIVSK